MRVPQVSERIKEAPAQALRGVFAGIGQLLLITDKLRNKSPYRDARAPQADKANGTTAVSPARPREETTVPDATAEAGTVAAEAAAAEPVSVKPVSVKPVAAEPEAVQPAAGEAAVAEAVVTDVAAAKATQEEPAAERPKPPKRQSARDFDKTGNVRLLGEDTGSPVLGDTGSPVLGATDAPAPLPNYDELSVASLRARLRNLDVAQVRGLAEYERAHAARDDVLAMYERRIAKLEADA